MHQPPRHALTDLLVTANAGSVVSAMTAASVAVASVDPSAAVAQTSPGDLTPLVCQKGNGLTPWHLVPMRLPVSSPAISRLRAALALQRRANGAPVAATATVDPARSAGSAVTGANAPSELSPWNVRTPQAARPPLQSLGSLTSQLAHLRPASDPAQTSS